MIPAKIIFIPFSFLLSGPLFALMDYSSGERSNEPSSPVERVRSESPRPQARKKGPKWLDMGIFYKSLDVQSGGEKGKITKMAFAAHIQTQSNIFIDLSYFQASADDNTLVESDSMQEGNPEIILGFNWIRVGRGPEAALVNIFGGVDVGTSGSELGHSRSDKILGVETIKRFDDFALGLSYMYKLTGNPGTGEELKIGNIGKIKAMLGWAATPDIRFSLEANATSVRASDDEGFLPEKKLQEKISFASVKSSLHLLIGQFYDLELGAVFRTNKSRSSQSLINARLLSEDGSYGNEVFAALNFSL